MFGFEFTFFRFLPFLKSFIVGIRCEILQYRHLQNQRLAILSEILHMIHISKNVIHNLKHLIKIFLQQSFIGIL